MMDPRLLKGKYDKDDAYIQVLIGANNTKLCPLKVEVVLKVSYFCSQ